MKKLLITVLALTLCILFIGCSGSNKNTDSSVNTSPSSVQSDNKNSSGNQSSQQNSKANDSQTSEPLKQEDNSALPEYKASESKSQQSMGSLQVNLNGSDKTYTTNYPIDNKGLSGSWEILLNNRDSIYITLPSNVKSGDEFTAEDGKMSTSSWGPPAFSFMYKDPSGNNTTSLGDGTNSFDAFGLIIDKWGGRGGYVEGRFATEIRPLIGDTIIMKNGRFKIKIRD